MRVVKIAELKEEPMGEATYCRMDRGAVSRSRQTIIPDGDSDNYRCSVVNFKQGATTGWHAHTCDQILVVTGGSGIVATEHEEGDQRRRRGAHQGWRAALARCQSQYDDVAHYHYDGRWGKPPVGHSEHASRGADAHDLGAHSPARLHIGGRPSRGTAAILDRAVVSRGGSPCRIGRKDRDLAHRHSGI